MASTDVTFAGLQQKLPRLLAQLNSGALSHVRIMDRIQTTGSSPNSVVESLTPVGVLFSYANYVATDTTGAADITHLPMNVLQRQDSVGRIAHLLRAAQTTGIATIANTAVAATGSITCVATASLVNGDKFTIGDGIAAAQTFVYDTDGTDTTTADVRILLSGKARGKLDVVATASLVNGDKIALDDGTNPALTFEYNVDATLVPASAANIPINLSGKAWGSITALAKASLIEGKVFVLDDGVHAPTNFEFDGVGGAADGVSGGNIAVDVSGGASATQTADAMRLAINNVGAGLAITAFGTGTIVYLRNDALGVAGNTTPTTDQAGLTIVPFTGGAAAAITTAAGVATATAAAINAAAPLAINAQGVGAVVYLNNEAVGVAGNTAITEVVTHASYVATNFANGAAAATATAAAVAAKTDTAITTAYPNLSTVVTDNVIAITHKIKGALGNVAIGDSVTASGFVAEGMHNGIVAGGTIVLGADRNGDCLFENLEGGPGAANYRVRIVVSGLNTARSIALSGTGNRDLTINLATDGAGVVAASETATAIAAEVNADSSTKLIWHATAQGTGASKMIAAVYVALAAGQDLSGTAGPLVYYIDRTRGATTPQAVMTSYSFATLLASAAGVTL